MRGKISPKIHVENGVKKKTEQPISGSTKCYPCQGLGIFRQEKWLLENWPRLRERSWIFSSETATTFLSFSEYCGGCQTLHTQSSQEGSACGMMAKKLHYVSGVPPFKILCVRIFPTFQRENTARTQRISGVEGP